MKGNDANDEYIRLSDVGPGEWAEVYRIDEHSELSRRLCDLGIRPGAYLGCERISFLGDPAAFRITTEPQRAVRAGTVVAIRKCDAKDVYVWPLKIVTEAARQAVNRRNGRGRRVWD